MGAASHNDSGRITPIALEVERLAGGRQRLRERFPQIVREAIDFVVDPVRTARTSVSELDNVEKTFLGLKIEHFIRDFLCVSRGVRDLVIAAEDVDVKNTIGGNWMIPHETYSEEGLCLLSRIDDSAGRCSLGLVVARLDYLGSPNRDSKRALTAHGRSCVKWLVESAAFPDSAWAGLDMERFRELRQVRGGARRASFFFRENPDRWIRRQVVQGLLFDQRDYMKRLRGNGGARDLLEPLGYELEVTDQGDCRATRLKP